MTTPNTKQCCEEFHCQFIEGIKTLARIIGLGQSELETQKPEMDILERFYRGQQWNVATKHLLRLVEDWKEHEKMIHHMYEMKRLDRG